MTATLPILTSAPSINVLGGKHTRNKRAAALRTCATCPSDTKSSCSSVCSEMERYLDGNGGTISHNSPVAGQLKWDSVNDITEPFGGPETIPGTVNESLGSATKGSGGLMLRYAVDSVRMERLTETTTPESVLLDTEAAGRAETLILQHISSFCESAVKKNDRERSIVESIIVLHYLEGYSTNRTAEILGERFEEFAGYRENERSFRSDRNQKLAAPKVEREPKGRFKVARTLKKFQEFIRGTHLSAAIHMAMETGSVEPVKKFAVKA